VTDFLERLLKATNGRTLVLFTSHRMLRDVYARLKPGLEAADICLLGQGIDGSRSRLVEDLQTTERTVIFGATSFWEGVDIPGEQLSCVVIVRLPSSSSRPSWLANRQTSENSSSTASPVLRTSVTPS
jgi:ATP-dependent DNA helicase DinG